MTDLLPNLNTTGHQAERAASDLLCAFVTRHAPTSEQLQALAAYRVIHVPDRLRSADARWQRALELTGYQRPDVLVMVAPPYWLRWMLRHLMVYSPQTTLVHAVMNGREDGNWSGCWARLVLVGGELRRVNWQPKGY